MSTKRGIVTRTTVMAIHLMVVGLLVSGAGEFWARAADPRKEPPDFSRQEVVPLWPNGAPGSEGQTSPEKVQGKYPYRAVTNVHNPSLTVFLPSKEKVTGAAVIVCPGGGFRGLMIDHDGYDVARWLSSHGVAAFVLKYRLMGQGANYKPDVHALADARRAVRLIRSRAKEWSIDPDRVGIIGL